MLKDMVNYPSLEEKYQNGTNKWYDSGEGGLNIFLVVLHKRFGDKDIYRNLAGLPWWIPNNVCMNPQIVAEIESNLHVLMEEDDYKMHGHPLIASVLIGSTPTTYCRNTNGGTFDRVFQPTYEDLTEKGKALFNCLTSLYGRKPFIVTLLDI